MKINSVDNTNFQALHVTPETLKKIGCTEKMLLSNPQIKECAEKYEVLVTAEKKQYRIDRRDGFTKDKIFPTAYLLGTIWGLPHLAGGLSALGITDAKYLMGAGIAVIGGAMMSLWKIISQKLNYMKIEGAQQVSTHNIEDFNTVKFDELKTSGITSTPYTIKRTEEGIIEAIPDIAQQIRDKEIKMFYYACINDAELDNMYTPENFLKNLKQIQNRAKQENIKDVFGYPVNKGGDTLLTMFFDVAIPQKTDSDERFEAYYAIINEIAKTNKDNFNQKDSNGISILEKIMNSENTYILPILKGSKFSYSPFLKYAYDNIQDTLFKKQLKTSVDFNFDLLEGDEGK